MSKRPAKFKIGHAAENVASKMREKGQRHTEKCEAKENKRDGIQQDQKPELWPYVRG